MVDKSVSVPITCPNCGEKFEKTLAGMEREKQFGCPNCPARFDAKDFVPGLEKAERDLVRKLRDALKKRR